MISGGCLSVSVTFAGSAADRLAGEGQFRVG
jgi:hypothetical protein